MEPLQDKDRHQGVEASLPDLNPLDATARKSASRKVWARIGFVILVLVILAVFGYIAKMLLPQNRILRIPRIPQLARLTEHSEKPVFEEALMKIKQDADLLKELGEPLKMGKVLRFSKKPQENQKENILAEFEIAGSLKKVFVYADATVDTGVVFFRQLVLYFKNPSRKVWQVPYYRDKRTTA